MMQVPSINPATLSNNHNNQVFLIQLPSELLEKIFGHLTLHQIEKMRGVNQYLNKMVSSEFHQLWRKRVSDLFFSQEKFFMKYFPSVSSKGLNAMTAKDCRDIVLSHWHWDKDWIDLKVKPTLDTIFGGPGSMDCLPFLGEFKWNELKNGPSIISGMKHPIMKAVVFFGERLRVSYTRPVIILKMKSVPPPGSASRQAIAFFMPAYEEPLGWEQYCPYTEDRVNQWPQFLTDKMTSSLTGKVFVDSELQVETLKQFIQRNPVKLFNFNGRLFPPTTWRLFL